MKTTIRIWLLSALMLCNCAIADERPTVIKQYFQPPLKPQVKAARQLRDLDNPLFTGRVDYHLTTKAKKIAALHTKYQPQFDEAWKWWSKLIVPEYLPANPKLALSAYVGKSDQDDLIGARYLAKDMQLQIIDGRSITLVVSPLDRSKYLVPNFEIRRPFTAWKAPKGFHYDDNWELVKDTEPAIVELSITEQLMAKYPTFTEQEKCEMYVHAVARQLLRFDYSDETSLAKTRLETRNYSTQGGGYGVIVIESGPRGGWFINGTITWWSDGKTVVFDVRKLLQPPSSKFGIHARHIVAREHAFGLLPTDKQKFERFFAHATLDFYTIFDGLYHDERIAKYRPQRKVTSDNTNSTQIQPRFRIPNASSVPR